MSKELRLLTNPKVQDAQLITQLIQDRILWPVHLQVWQKFKQDSLLPFRGFQQLLQHLSQTRPLDRYLLLALLQHYSYEQLLITYEKDDYKLDADLLTAFNHLSTYYGMSDYE